MDYKPIHEAHMEHVPVLFSKTGSRLPSNGGVTVDLTETECSFTVIFLVF